MQVQQASDAYSQTVEEVLDRLNVGPQTGLDEAEAERRLERFGANQIEQRKRASTLTILLHQLTSPIVYLLAGATVLAFVFGHHLEGTAVLIVLIVNTIIGYATEARAVHSMEALRSLGVRSAHVRREGQAKVVPAEDLVPGDIVMVEAGDIVSADLRLLNTADLGVNESTLTGESMPVDKSTDAVPPETRLADRTSMVFKGTAITGGSAVGVVVATGVATELGHISQLVQGAKPVRSPLEQRLADVASQLVWLTIILTTAIVAIGVARGSDAVLMVSTGIALGVAAIPEGLPVVATLALAQGMWRMARQNALLERLSAVETFGSVTLILTDKTGTLTENRMTLASVCLPADELVPKPFDHGAMDGDQGPLLEGLLTIACLCNSSVLDQDSETEIGDPMEIALLRAGANAGLVRDQLLARHPIVQEHAFDTAIRMMATIHEADDSYLYAIKGAPEEVLSRCVAVRHAAQDVAFDDEARSEWGDLVERLAGEGLRVLALARKTGPSPDAPLYDDLVLLGIVGLHDPARADVANAIAACHVAGIKVAIVTGDHVVTARSIGRQVGLPVDGTEAIEGHNLARIDFDGAELRSTTIFARVNPEEKLALVHAFQRAGEVVAMTGDGVNDAPALRQADIGVAMGKRGTDVAREAAAMVLLDDSFATIVKAIAEGRVIFGNIRRFAAYLLSCNLSEVMVIGLAVALGLALPILPLQILFLNFVTDVFPAFALATTKGDDGVMQRPPRPPGEALLGRPQWRRILIHGLTLTAAVFGAMIVAGHVLGLEGEDLVTVNFLTLAFAQLWHVFNMRRPEGGLFRNELTGNRWIWAALHFCAALLVLAVYQPDLAAILGLAAPSLSMWLVVLGMSLTPLLLLQASGMLVRLVRRDVTR